MELNVLIMVKKKLDKNLREDTAWPVLWGGKGGMGCLYGLLTATQPWQEVGRKGLELKPSDLHPVQLFSYYLI